MPLSESPQLPPAALPATARHGACWRATALLALVVGTMAGVPMPARADSADPASAIPGLEERHLDPAFWIARLREPGAMRWDAAAVAAHNARLLALDPSMHDLDRLPASLPGADVARRIRGLSRRPSAARFHSDGNPVDAAAFDTLQHALALDAITDSVHLRWALVVGRAALRTYPTPMRVHSAPGEADIDRFQESALFPGTPVAILHASRDSEWAFVLSPRYAAWIELRHLAEGPREIVLAYPRRSPFHVVTGAKPRTVFNPDEARVSELQLDMGVRVPAASPNQNRIHGQHAQAGWAVELPVREAGGSLAFAPALLPRQAGVTEGYLAHTAANVIAQGFAFLGERYGWGHDYNGRDCSGFVSEVYASMGIGLPRNTSDQSRSLALDHDAFDLSTTPDERAAAIAALEVGDLVFVPGHVMLVIGRIDGAPWVIHDIHGGGVLPPGGGPVRRLGLNGVAVTPLLPLAFDDGTRYTERMTAIVRLR